MKHRPLTVAESTVLEMNSTTRWRIQRETGAPGCKEEREPQGQADAFAEQLYAFMGPHLSLRNLRALLSVLHRELECREMEKSAFGKDPNGFTQQSLEQRTVMVN